MPPLKPGPWTDARDTSQFGHGCTQNVRVLPPTRDDVLSVFAGIRPQVRAAVWLNYTPQR